MSARYRRGGEIDPLERRGLARAVVLVALTATSITLALGPSSEIAHPLPGVALGSPLVLQLERALIVGAGVAALLVFAARGWAGYFPSKISTAGAEYLEPPDVHHVVQSGNAIYDEFERLNFVHHELAESTRVRLDEIERRMGIARQTSRTDDML